MTDQIQARPETVFLQHDDVFRVSDNMATVTHKLLPGGVYLLGFSPLSGFYLTMQDHAVSSKTKVYGSAADTAERIIKTFKDRAGRTTGVLLGGEKGSGKTMIMSRMSATLAAEGIPTIIINANYTGDAFNSFISAIKQPAVLSFDEFEKVYDAAGQEAMLTLLSGLFETHKLVVMTVNDESKINQHMLNRPGRLFYRIKYRGVDAETVRQYCGDHLKNQDHVDEVVALSETIQGFNFDMLVSLVEEMNRYNEPVEKAIRMMNITYSSYGATYNVTLFDSTGKSYQANAWDGTITIENHRFFALNLNSIKDVKDRNRMAIKLEKIVLDRNAHRDDSDLSFKWAITKKDEDGDEITYIDSIRDAIEKEPENVILDDSHWQHIQIGLLDENFVSTRGKTTRFKVEDIEVVLTRQDRKPNPFGYF